MWNSIRVIVAALLIFNGSLVSIAVARADDKIGYVLPPLAESQIKNDLAKCGANKKCLIDIMNDAVDGSKVAYKTAVQNMEPAVRDVMGMLCTKKTKKVVMRVDCYQQALGKMRKDVDAVIAARKKESPDELMNELEDVNNPLSVVLLDLCEGNVSKGCFDFSIKGLKEQLKTAQEDMIIAFYYMARWGLTKSACEEKVGLTACSAGYDWSTDKFIVKDSEAPYIGLPQPKGSGNGDSKAADEAKKKAEEAKKKADAAAKKKAAEEAKKKADEEAKKKADEEAKKKADEDAKKKADEDAKKKGDPNKEPGKKDGDEKAVDQKDGDGKPKKSDGNQPEDPDAKKGDKKVEGDKKPPEDPDAKKGDKKVEGDKDKKDDKSQNGDKKGQEGGKDDVWSPSDPDADASNTNTTKGKPLDCSAEAKAGYQKKVDESPGLVKTPVRITNKATLMACDTRDLQENHKDDVPAPARQAVLVLFAIEKRVAELSQKALDLDTIPTSIDWALENLKHLQETEGVPGPDELANLIKLLEEAKTRNPILVAKEQLKRNKPGSDLRNAFCPWLKKVEEAAPGSTANWSPDIVTCSP